MVKNKADWHCWQAEGRKDNREVISRRARVCVGDSYGQIEKCSSDLYSSFLDPMIK